MLLIWTQETISLIKTPVSGTISYLAILKYHSTCFIPLTGCQSNWSILNLQFKGQTRLKKVNKVNIFITYICLPLDTQFLVGFVLLALVFYVVSCVLLFICLSFPFLVTALSVYFRYMS